MKGYFAAWGEGERPGPEGRRPHGPGGRGRAVPAAPVDVGRQGPRRTRRLRARPRLRPAWSRAWRRTGGAGCIGRGRLVHRPAAGRVVHRGARPSPSIGTRSSIVGELPALTERVRRRRGPRGRRGRPDRPVPGGHPRAAHRDRPAGPAPLRPGRLLGRPARRHRGAVHHAVGAGDDPACVSRNGRSWTPWWTPASPESRSDALVWAVRLVGENADAWLGDLRPGDGRGQPAPQTRARTWAELPASGRLNDRPRRTGRRQLTRNSSSQIATQ